MPKKERKKQKIRFCPICRVSTPGQAEHGTSLENQKEANIRAVEFLGGTIPDYCWQYSGQESATPDKERELLFKHLDDCDKDLFDAVMFDDPSRFNRDPVTNDRAIKTYLKNGIRFFIGSMELDLDNPDHVYMIDSNAVFNKRMAAQLRKITVRGKLKAAKKAARGECKVPTSPKRMPFGRQQVKDKSGKWVWVLDKKKAKLMQWAAKEILNEKSTKDIAHILTTKHHLPFKSPEYLRKVLTERCGDEWYFQGVKFEIPRILDDSIIQAVKEQFKFNLICIRKDVKKYPLSGFLLCEECGRAFSGYICKKNYKGKITEYRYYKHPTGKYISCSSKFEIRQDAVEEAVFKKIFKRWYDETGFKKAIADALPDKKAFDSLKRSIRQIKRDISKIDSDLDRLVDLAMAGTLKKRTIKKREAALYLKQEQLSEDLSKKEQRLKSMPDPDQFNKDAEAIRKFYLKYYGSEKRLLDMGYDEKRELIHQIFSGKNDLGESYGIYVEKAGVRKYDLNLFGRINDRRRPWLYGNAHINYASKSYGTSVLSRG